MDLGLKGRVAIVAASSQGLGKAVAVGLAGEGATVAMCARNRAAIDSAAAEVRSAGGGEVFPYQADVTCEEQVHAFVEAVRARFGRIDICVANAGGPPSKTFEQSSVEDWRGAVDLNLMSTLYLARETLPVMKERRWGRFIAITSITVKQPVGNLVLSNAVRAGVVGLVKSLSNEFAPYNVLVNNICPGYTLTARLKDLSGRIAASEGIAEEDVVGRWSAEIPLGRLAKPEEFAAAVVFLASERASYITGVSLPVDGGFIKGL